MTNQEIRNAAADLIEKDGWIQGGYHLEGEGYCLSGALNEIMNCTSLGTPPYEELCAVVGVRYLCDWNDKPERTKEEVIKLLRGSK